MPQQQLESTMILVNDFFVRKLKIVVLTVLTYAALC